VEEVHIRTCIPLKKNREENIAILKEEMEYRGVSVIIAQRECVQTASRKKKKTSLQPSPKERENSDRIA
jgi:indolepyruvate ferredoxin oxidoreductase alpha subunit